MQRKRLDTIGDMSINLLTRIQNEFTLSDSSNNAKERCDLDHRDYLELRRNKDGKQRGKGSGSVL